MSTDPTDSRVDPDPERRSEQLARRLGRPLAEWMVAADAQDVASVLESADKRFLRDILTDIGLRKRWQQLQFKPRAYLALAQALTTALYTTELRDRGILAARIVFTWWGRRAVSVFSGTDLAFRLTQIQLTIRFAETVGPLSFSHSGQIRDDLRAAVDRLDAGDPLNRLFISLWRAGVDRLSTDDFRTDLGLEAPTGGDEQPSGEVPENTTELMTSGLTTSNSDGGQTDDSLPAASLDLNTPEETNLVGNGDTTPPTIAHSNVVRDTSQPGPASGQLIDCVERAAEDQAITPSDDIPLLADLRKLLEECQVLTERIPDLLQTGAHSQAETTFARLRDARRAVDLEVQRLRKELVSLGLTLPNVPPDVYASIASADRYLDEARSVFSAAASKALEKVEEAKAVLASRFIAVGMDVPGELPPVQTAAELLTVTKAWDETLSLEEVFLQLRDFQESTLPARLWTLHADTRLRLYERLVSLPASEQSTARLLAWVVQDAAALRTSTERGKTILSVLIVNALEKYLLMLPPETWQAYGAVLGSSSVKELFSGDLGHVVTSAIEADLIDLDQLQKLPGFIEASLPQSVELALLRHRFVTLPPTTPTSEQAALALRTPLDGNLTAVFIDRLIDSGEYQSATVIAMLAARSHNLTKVPSRLVDAFARTLVQAVIHRPGQREVIRQLLEQDSEWLMDEPDLLTVLLFLAAETGAERPLAEMPYHAADVTETASLRRPALVRRWLLDRRLSGESDEQLSYREDLLRRAAAALRDWDRGLQRPSTYTNWEFAADYQRLFNERLTNLFNALENGYPVEDLEPEEWIDDARNGPERLPEVVGRARQNMISYLETQKERLALLSECRAIVPAGTRLREVLSRSPAGLHEALRAEFEKEPINSILRPIYSVALTNVSR